MSIMTSYRSFVISFMIFGLTSDVLTTQSFDHQIKNDFTSWWNVEESWDSRNCFFNLPQKEDISGYKLLHHKFSEKVEKSEFMSIQKDCQLTCIYDKEDYDVWQCFWIKFRRPCTKITSTLLSSAVTNDPHFPFLRNFSSPRFHILLGPLGITELEDGFLTDFPQVKGFTMMYNPIKQLGKNTFINATQLDYVQLSNNKLQILQEPFLHLKNVKKLYLNSNDLTIVNDSTFGGLSELNKLALINNKIREIDSRAFKMLKQVKWLYLRCNFLQFVKSDLLKDKNQLKTIDLGMNLIRKIKMPNASSVEELSLYDNKISNIHKVDFQGLSKLKILYFRKNPYMQIEPGSFQFSKTLRQLFLGCCGDVNDCLNFEWNISGKSFQQLHVNFLGMSGCVVKITDMAFDGLITDTLAIEFNPKLTNIRNKTFKGIKALRLLSLAMNNISSIGSSAFKDVSQMANLQLWGNNLFDIPTGLFQQLKRLTVLNLDKNHLSVLKKHYFHGLSSLQALYISSNQVKKIEAESFIPLQNLIHLDLSGNQLNIIEMGSFKTLIFLEDLILSNNYVSSLDNITTQGLISLKNINLSHNRISFASAADFHKLSAVENIVLQKNNMTQFDCYDETAGLPTFLKKIDLSMNNISSLSFDCFEGTHISEIFLDWNSFTITPLYNREQMRHFSISNNRIEKLQLEYKSRLHLDFLDLSFNRLSELSATEVQILKDVLHLNLSKNPWKCSCSAEDYYLMEFLLKKSSIISCCPDKCHCKADVKRTYIDCQNTRQNNIPKCMPYDKVEMDLSKNQIHSIHYGIGLKNVSFLNLSSNFISTLTTDVVSNMSTIECLDLCNNHLTKLPIEIRNLKRARVYVHGNNFSCMSCEQVQVLYDIVQSTPQSITCPLEEKLDSIYNICYLEHTIIPYVGIALFAFSLMVTTHFIVRKMYLRKMKNMYMFKHFSFTSKFVKVEFENELAILKQLKSHHFLKIHSHHIFWIPKQSGFIFWEKPDFGLRQGLLMAKNLDIAIDRLQLCKEVLTALEYLHSMSICHNDIAIDSFYLQFKDSKNCYQIKLGDFSQAKLINDNEVETCDQQQTPFLTNSESVSTKEDLVGSAHVLFSILTLEERVLITNDDLKLIPEIEVRTLILALLKGIAASKALMSSAFTHVGKRIEHLTSLSAVVKQNVGKKFRTEPFDGVLLAKLEENAGMVIGGVGNWMKLLHPMLLRDFGIGLKCPKYLICSFADLLRFCRNVFAHINEEEYHGTNKIVFGTLTPTLKEIYDYFSNVYPFLYLHAYCCFKYFSSTMEEFEADIYLQTYLSYENDSFAAQMTEPLQKTNTIFVELRNDLVEILELVTLPPSFPDMPYSIIKGDKVLTMIPNVVSKVWTNAPGHLRITDQNLQIIKCSTKILEGSVISVSKFEVSVIVPQLLEDPSNSMTALQFKISYNVVANVKAIQGRVYAKLPKNLQKTIQSNQIVVKYRETILKQKSNIAQTIRNSDEPIIVSYPEAT